MRPASRPGAGARREVAIQSVRRRPHPRRPRGAPNDTATTVTTLGTMRRVASACACCGETGDRTVRLLSHPTIAICHRCLDWLDDRRDRQLDARGGPARALGVEPIFSVKDVRRSLDHYERMGFSTSEHDATHASAHLDGVTIRLAEDAGERSAGGSIYLHVDDADRLAEAWRLAGLAVVGPEDLDHGGRQGSHTDPDGNRIRFGSPLRRPDPG